MLVFLFTDIEGSTRLWEEHTGAMRAVIACHDALLQEQVSAAGGRITKHTGDGVTAAFDGGEPLACALDTQMRFAAESWGPVGELRIRIGLHAGQAEWLAGPQPGLGDYHGPPVNETARVMSAAWGGQILLTPEVTRVSALPDQVTLLDLGEHLLKNVSAPQQLFQLLHPDLPRREFPPPRTLSGQSIRQAVGEHGDQMAALEPRAMGVSLLVATLMPALQGDLDPESGALEGNLGVLEDLGAVSLRSFLAGFAQRLQAGRPLPATEVAALLQRDLQELLAAGGERAVALRTDTSRLLQALHGVEAAMAAATGEIKEALARGLADLGSQFSEFRWMLGGLQETLVEVRARQDLQLTMQQEQLDLQEEQLGLQQRQLARTDEILQLQRDQRRVGLPVPRPEAVRPPAFLDSDQEPYRPPVLVAREREMAWLEGSLDKALSGHGQVVFVTGGPGRGKTALLAEFARQAMEAQPDLLAASGTCNAYSGLGDPYLPFREVLDMLTGDVEGRWASGLIASDHARRLWLALPQVIQALLARGPHVVPALVSTKGLFSRAMAAAPEGAPWLQALEDQLSRGAGAAEGLEQSHLFQQVSNVLRALAESHPLLLILDDLQWVDRTSSGLLFHLGRRLEGARILIAGAYRPEEMALVREGERHPLEKALAEFKRIYGDVWLDLAEVADPEGQRFVDAYLETEPNCLGDRFRQALAARSGGHPMFTVELLRAMQERGDLVRDETGRWVEEPALDWDLLPARVEGVIGERIGRLGEELRQILTVASVEGEDFTAEVVAQVRQVEARELVRRLSGELEREHRLVRARGLRRLEARRLALYRFQHHLFQEYLYNHLDEAERAYLHEDVGTVLEALYGRQTDEVAVQLARHFQEAGVNDKAAHHLGRAGVLAAERYANEEALAYLSQALEYVPERSPQRLDLLAARARVYGLVAEWSAQRADLEAIVAQAQALEDEARPRDAIRCDALIPLAECLYNTGVAGCREPAERAAEMAREMGDPLREGRALRVLGLHDYSTGRYARSRSTLEAALDHIQEIGRPGETAACLADLSLTLNALDEPTAALEAAKRAVALSQEAGDRHLEATILRRVGIFQRAQGRLGEAKRSIEAALALHREMGDRLEECLALSALGVTLGCLGKPDEAAASFEQMLEMAGEIGSARVVGWGVGSMDRYVFLPQGEYEAGLAFLENWLAKARQANQEYVAAEIQLHRARLLFLLGQQETALEVAQSVLPDADRLLDYGDQVWLLQIMGGCHTELGRFHEARGSFQEGLERAEKYSEAVDAGLFWLHLAELAYLEGDQAGLRAAIEQLPRPDVILPTLYWYHQAAARLHLALGAVELALESSNRALQDMEIQGEGWLAEQCYLTHTHVLRALGRDAEAVEYLQRAYDRVMLVAGKTHDESLRQSWLENVPDNREIVAEWEARAKQREE